MKKQNDVKSQLKNLGIVMELKSIDKKERVIRGVIGTTGSLDRHGDTVNPEGWMIENFLKNPVIFVNHNSWELPVGKAINVEKTENGLVFDIKFAKGTKQADEVWALVEQKMIQAWSVGFIVLDWGKPGDDYTIMRQELLELSIVGIPANPDAMSPKQAKSLKALQEYIEAHGEKKEASTSGEGRGESAVGESGGEEKPEENTEKHIDDEDVVKPDESVQEEDKKPQEDEEKSVQVMLEKVLEKVESLESEVKELKEAHQKSQKNIADFTKDIEPDESVAEDNVFLALNAVQAELRSENKESGKALNQLNKLIKTIGKDN